MGIGDGTFSLDLPLFERELHCTKSAPTFKQYIRYLDKGSILMTFGRHIQMTLE